MADDGIPVLDIFKQLEAHNIFSGKINCTCPSPPYSVDMKLEKLIKRRNKNTCQMKDQLSRVKTFKYELVDSSEGRPFDMVSYELFFWNQFQVLLPCKVPPSSQLRK